MSFFRFLIRLGIILGCACIGALIGAKFQEYRILGRPEAFRSEAKLVAKVQFINRELEERKLGLIEGTTSDTLESAEMSRRARERVRALYPDVHEYDVAISAVASKGSGCITIHATGQEPKHTRIFLDALLDEFIALRLGVREKVQGPELQKVRNEAAALQKEMKETEAALEKARAGAGSVSANLEHVRLLARLTTLRNERDERRLKIGTLPENDAARTLMQTRLSAIELEIKDMETQLQRQEAAASELRVLTEKFDAVKQAYDKKFEQAGELQTSIEDADLIAIQERATPAFVIVEEWGLPVVVTAVGGGVIGLVLSLLLVSSPRPQQRPRAVV